MRANFSLDSGRINLILIVSFSLLILAGMSVIRPATRGDGQEYLLVVESFFNHLTPDLREADIKSFEASMNRSGIEYSAAYGKSSFQARDGKNYSSHFWLYSLSALPAKLLLRVFGLDEVKALQITNSLLLMAALLSVCFLARLSDTQKLLFSLLLVCSPALWFVHWTHPEIFSISFVTISIAFMTAGRLDLATLCASIAATQSQQLLLFALFVWLRGIANSKSRVRDFSVLSALALPAILPNLFYYFMYGTPSLIYSGGKASLGNLSLFRVYELFFDLNIGLVSYIPITLLLFFFVAAAGALSGKSRLGLHVLLLMCAMFLVSSSTINWNHGTSGPSRYAVVALPLIFYVVVANLDELVSKKLLPLLLFGVILQLVIVLLGGGLNPQISYVDHSYSAKFVLDTFPRLYSPSQEIFCERTNHVDGSCDGMAVYMRDKKCRKALVGCGQIGELEKTCGRLPKPKESYCPGAPSGTRFYVDF